MMKTIYKQKGIGLVEVLVALIVLALGVLGYAALQYKAVEANSESGSRIIAVNLARDLTERMRANPAAFATYKTRMGSAESQKTYSTNCFSNFCSATQFAEFDVAQVVLNAERFAMTMNIMKCQGNNNNRQCIYVAWGDTSATDGTNAGDCTNATSYRSDSTCLVMEAY